MANDGGMSSEDLLALIAAGPSGGAVETQGPARPIGIPDTFQAYGGQLGGKGADTPRFVPAPYYDGAEFGPRTLSPESRARIQSAMAQAGLIGKNDTFRVGVWDETSAKAYKKVLAYANQGGLKAEDALQELLSAPQMDGEGNAVGGDAALEQDPGKVSAISSALSLEEQVQQAAQARLGRKLKRAEVAKFASIYQGMEGAFNTKANTMQDDAAVTGVDSEIEELPGADVAADQFIDSNYAQEAAGQDAYGYLGALRSLLGG